MSKFYFSLWLSWLTRLALSTFFVGSILALVVTVYIWGNQGFLDLGESVSLALIDIFQFWFMIFANIALLISFFTGMKYIFNNCKNGYFLELSTCPQEGVVASIESVGYGDLVKVWRKWLILMIWLVGAQMIVALVLSEIFTSFESLFDWFNIFILYGFISLAGYFSFIVLSGRCKRVRIVKC